MVALLIGNQQETRRKVDQFGAITFFLFLRSTENSEKSRPTQKILAPSRMKFCPTQNSVLVAALTGVHCSRPLVKKFTVLNVVKSLKITFFPEIAKTYLQFHVVEKTGLL